MISSRPGNHLGMRRRSSRLALALLGTVGCNTGSPASPRLDASAGEGTVEAPDAAALDGEPDGTIDASEDGDASDADAEAGYAVCPEVLDATFGSIYGEI